MAEYSGMSKRDLSAMCESRGLKRSGNKTTMIDRLTADDRANASTSTDQPDDDEEDEAAESQAPEPKRRRVTEAQTSVDEELTEAKSSTGKMLIETSHHAG
jgi:hypothetical protein